MPVAMIRALSIGILSAAALIACSTTPSHPSSRTAAAISPASCSAAGAEAMRPGLNACTAEVHTYSGKEIRQTGKTDVAHALQMLDPSVTVIAH
jgi:hypothetical protein